MTWLMTFGAKAEVLGPEEARDIIRRNAEETLKIYGGLEILYPKAENTNVQMELKPLWFGLFLIL